MTAIGRARLLADSKAEQHDTVWNGIISSQPEDALPKWDVGNLLDAELEESAADSQPNIGMFDPDRRPACNRPPRRQRPAV